MKSILKLIVILICLQFLLLPSDAVFAQETSAQSSGFLPECILNGDISGGQCGDSADIFLWLAINVGRYLFSFIGALALLFFVYGGVILITSQGNRENVSKGTKAMVAAVTGLVIAFSGYALITFLSQSVGVKSEFLLTPQNTATKK
ncbi:MAG: hypothetical protein COU29_02530 [Candidatus Magasanikbacteria bacterium CG10_big_fil_rev_8_21_14_0_10_36_32]|uniref:Uncharacterized protein n=1 Tax=Candidatus Magasanikbacteria bacterium CG10_big_fil_rev_8_21_14_0_10_36_32 TaxID=1974646 RepID=A0A2M6W766_9BACT|nr:MAG: hypothetical protein COU29_02530 [Candidatus Magasanikbacteria bacterium CG10_big_fil_rev_8_21_14_0_10_36_32]